MFSLNSPVTALGKLNKKELLALKSLKIETVKELIFYFPFKYDEFGEVIKIADIKDQEAVTVEARVAKIASRRSFKSRLNMTEASLADDTGYIRAIWFNQPFVVKNLKDKAIIRFSGRITRGKFGLQIQNPRYEAIDAPKVSTAPMTPVYTLALGMGQAKFRKLVLAALAKLDVILSRSRDGIPPEAGKDNLPRKIIVKYELMTLDQALPLMHFPDTRTNLNKARRRIVFDNLLRLQLSIGNMRKFRSTIPGYAIVFDQPKTKSFVDVLPFKLTVDQKKAAWEIIKDMERPNPMQRLLNGDVGSGKTIVAALAMANVAWSGRQGALMAPTEILARQHFATFSKLFGQADLVVALLTNGRIMTLKNGEEKLFLGVSGRVEIQQLIETGVVHMVIGTHALIENKIRFKNLALSVIDEQHRFGVRARHSLIDKNGSAVQPHLLSMTATPIPRTLALSIYGDLDLSVLMSKPPNRMTVQTDLAVGETRVDLYNHALSEIKNGRQVFVVAPMIDRSDFFDATSVVELAKELKSGFFKDVSVGIIHGRMNSKEQEKLMADFKQNKINVLISTTVIEVGVDIPNATVMIIEGAERFGLAQLHQLRGRVGRGAHQSYCFVMTSSPSRAAYDRLKFFAATTDGFKLAERDLQIRGPGNILGSEQSGQMDDLFVGDNIDLNLIKQTREVSESILKNDFVSLDEMADYLEEGIDAAHSE